MHGELSVYIEFFCDLKTVVGKLWKNKTAGKWFYDVMNGVWSEQLMVPGKRTFDEELVKTYFSMGMIEEAIRILKLDLAIPNKEIFAQFKYQARHAEGNNCQSSMPAT